LAKVAAVDFLVEKPRAALQVGMALGFLAALGMTKNIGNGTSKNLSLRMDDPSGSFKS